MEFHEAAAIFPLMNEEDFEAFKQDIKEHGLKEHIVTYKGKIIDGRNRYRACRELNIKPSYVEWDGEGSLTEYAVSLNLHRRHLDTNTRAMLGVKIAESLREESRRRSLANLNHGDSEPEGDKPAPRGRSVEVAGRLVGTSSFPIKAAAKVVDSGDETLIAAVNANQVAVHNAAELLRLPPEERKTIIGKGPEEMLRVANELRQTAKPEEPKKTPRKSGPIAAQGVAAVKRCMDGHIEYWAKQDDPHAEKVFEVLTALRKELCG